MISNFRQVIPATIDISDYSCFSTCTINIITMYTFVHIVIHSTLCTGPPSDYTSSVLVNLFPNCPDKLFVSLSLFMYFLHQTFQFSRIQSSLPLSSTLIYGDSTRQVPVWKQIPSRNNTKIYHAIFNSTSAIYPNY